MITNTLEDHTKIIKENSNTLPRARWNSNRKSRLPQSRQGTIIIEGNLLTKVKFFEKSRILLFKSMLITVYLYL